MPQERLADNAFRGDCVGSAAPQIYEAGDGQRRGRFAEGARVRLVGLLGLREVYNGSVGVIRGFHEDTVRYMVDISTTQGCTQRNLDPQLSVRADNLVAVPAPLEAAVVEADVFQVQALLRDRADPNARSTRRRPLLQEAAAADDGRNLVALLLSFAADSKGLAKHAGVLEDGDAMRLLGEIFSEKVAGSDAKKILLASLDPGVLAHARKWLRLPGPFALGGVHPAACLESPQQVSECGSTATHMAHMLKSDMLRPVLTMTPRDDQPDALVVVLHGLFQSGLMLRRLVRELSCALPNARFIAPTAPTRKVWGHGPAWFNHLDQEEVFPQLEEQRREILGVLGQEYRVRGIGPDRVVLVGFSMGGIMAAWTALQVPQPLAGLVLLGTVGVVHEMIPPLPSAGGAQGLPVLQCHGGMDDLASCEGAFDNAEHLRELGCDVRFSGHDDVGHALSDEMVKEIRTWLCERLG